jgi:hypothetical protein
VKANQNLKPKINQIHRQLIQSLSVTGVFEYASLGGCQAKSSQTDTGSKVILFYISNIKVILSRP